jgi:membrane-associated protease RseP (regulator of RpoE activity)
VYTSESTATIAIVLLALGILGWGFIRARGYGKYGILSWWQSVILMVPWLIFFGTFAAGIYLNLVAILLMFVVSIAAYVTIGRRLREAANDPQIAAEIAKRIKERYRREDASNPDEPVDLAAVMAEAVPHLPEGDLQAMRGIFGIDTFFATETISDGRGVVFRGNLRGEPAIVHEKLTASLQEKLGDKYRLFLLEDRADKVVVTILPASSYPLPERPAQIILAIVLFIASIFTTGETVGTFLNFNFYENLDRWKEVLPLAAGIWSVLAAHEFGHIIMAKLRGAKMGIPCFLPSGPLASFGAITKFASVLKDRSQLFDIAIAGPAAGGLVSLILLLLGLHLSAGDTGFQIPTQFFQGSILVGALAKVTIGNAVHDATIAIHPLAILGWLGLVVTALNLLPAGSLDGGRIVQAIYGRKVARITTIATLAILGIVALFSFNPIILYWAAVIGFLQRGSEPPQSNELVEVDDTRATIGLLALFITIVILMPFSPDLAGTLGIGQ